MGKTSLEHKVSKDINSAKIIVVNIDVFSCRNDEDLYSLFATGLTLPRRKFHLSSPKEFVLQKKIIRRMCNNSPGCFGLELINMQQMLTSI